MKNDNYNLFIPVEDGYHFNFLRGDNKRHKLLGFFVSNNAGISAEEITHIQPVIVWNGNSKDFAIFESNFKDNLEDNLETPF